MRGWDVYGKHVTLTRPQEDAVKTMLCWDRGARVVLPEWPRGAGKTVVLVTVARYARARARGRLLADDPLAQERR